MPRFYFHFRDAEGITRDEIGAELESIEVARAEAEKGSRDILAERIKAGEPLDHEAIEVTDEEGRTVCVISFRDIVTAGLKPDES